MKFLLLLLSAFIVFSFVANAQSSVAPSKDVQIKTALLAAPADKRDAATVYAIDEKGNRVLLRQGSNEIICIADDPAKKGISVASYHKELEPFMQRGRELRMSGKKSDEIFATRESEAKSGKLVLPKQPTTLYVFSAKEEDYDRNTGEVRNGYLRYVIYIPYATSASTGLTEKPEHPGMPWIMHPGTHGAHIMINPPPAGGEKK